MANNSKERDDFMRKRRRLTLTKRVDLGGEQEFDPDTKRTRSGKIYSIPKPALIDSLPNEVMFTFN